jgi:hypothetical protein
MNRQDIDKQAEREGLALHKQQREYDSRTDRIRQRDNYNTTAFDKLFKKDIK